MPEIENALEAKLTALCGGFSGKTIERLDVGVFPWHGSIELSILIAGDECDPRDVAGWPHYNISGLQEGKWPEAAGVCKEMQRLWEADTSLSKNFFQLVAAIIMSGKVGLAISKFTRSEAFVVTLFDPDDEKSENFCAA